MTSSKRIQKELADIKAANLPYFTNIQVDDLNILVWRGLLVPNSPPYNKGAFVLEINFPPEYPFKPPQVMFKTKIYHPNIGEDGQICLPIIDSENWKPSTKIVQVLGSLIDLVNCPEPNHPIRPQLAEEFIKNKKKFLKNAEEFTDKFAEKRSKST